MAGLTRTTFNYALKQLYPTDRIESLVYRNAPLLAALTQNNSDFGTSIEYAIQYGLGGRGSADFSTAQTAGASTYARGKRVSLTPVSDYATANIDGIVMATARTNKAAFVRSVEQEMNAAIQTLKNRLARDLYRGGYGTVGVIATISSDTITFATPSDVNNFEEGDQVVFAPSESSDALRNSGGSLTVSRVDRSAKTVTFSANVSTVTGTSVGDYIFMKGDRENSASPTRLKVAGLQAWLPATVSSNDSFFGMNRSADRVRLAGNVLNPSAGTPINQVLLDAATEVAVQDGTLTHFFMHPDVFNDLQQSLESKVIVPVDVMKGKVGFRAIEIETAAGTVKCMADRNCPRNKVFGLDMDTWVLYAAGPICAPITHDEAGDWLRVYNADAAEVRCGHYLQLGCTAPGRNIVVTLLDT